MTRCAIARALDCYFNVDTSKNIKWGAVHKTPRMLVGTTSLVA